MPREVLSNMNDLGKGWFYKVLLALTLVQVVSIATMIVLPTGQTLPAHWGIVQASAMLLMVVLHAVHHIGGKQALAFFAVCVIGEWTCEQINISFGGIFFGHLIYDDVLVGPKIGDVPFVVPFTVGAFMWPPLVIGSIMLHERAVVVAEKGEGFIRLVFRCAIFAMIHVAWLFGIEPTAMKMGLYEYVGLTIDSPNTFYGVPMSEVLGWSLMAFGMYFVYCKFLAPRFEMPKERVVSPWVDSIPYLLYGGFALFLTVDPVDSGVGMAVLWTMGLYTLMSIYKLPAAVRASKARAEAG
jgi:uncharacterized membrane protein